MEMSTLQQKEKITIACHKSWESAGKGKMLLCVSGGADSTAMLTAFHKAGIPLEVAHCNFNLRASESLRDREFVNMLCKNLGVPFNLAEFDVAKEARKGESTEMTCRRLRYDFFRRLKDEKGFGRIVIAHNADDNVETFFINALRGSGTRGLKCMEEDNGEILRPLLKYRRKEILDFLKTNRQPYITDSSNLKSEDFRRNFLRNKIVPLLESKWEGFSKAISNTIDIQRRENKIVNHYTSEALKDVTDFLSWHIIYNFPDTETLINRFIEPFGGTPSIAKEMSKSAESLMPGKKWILGDDYVASFSRKGIKIEKNLTDINALVAPDGQYVKEIINAENADYDKILSAPRTEIYLPFDTSRYEWLPATREMRIKPIGMEGSQSVLKVLKDAGFSPSERRQFFVLVDTETGEPIWIPGIKRSRIHLVDHNTPIIYHLYRKA